MLYCTPHVWFIHVSVILKEKRQQLLNEIRTLCEASNYPGLVEFHGAFYTPESGQISIALEYVDGGSFADILKFQKVIPEDVLSCMVKKLLDVRITCFNCCCIIYYFCVSAIVFIF